MVSSHRYYFGHLAGDLLVDVLEALAAGAVMANAAWLRRNGWAPRLDVLAPRYTAPIAAAGDASCQGVALAPVLVPRGVGTCLDLACYHAGWVQARRSLPARVVIRSPIDDDGPLHALVDCEGDLFDPTRWATRKGL